MVYVCLAVTCHLHIWQNDSTESWPWRRKFSCRYLNPGPFNHKSDAWTTELVPLPVSIQAAHLKTKHKYPIIIHKIAFFHKPATENISWSQFWPQNISLLLKRLSNLKTNSGHNSDRLQAVPQWHFNRCVIVQKKHKWTIKYIKLILHFSCVWAGLYFCRIR